MSIRKTSADESVQEVVKYFINTEDEQKAKYWYHAVSKGMDKFQEAEDGHNKHEFVDDEGVRRELVGISALSYAEAPVMQEHLPEWPKERI